MAIMFYYKAKNEDFARTYYLKDNSIGGIGQIRKDPAILIKKLDEALK